MMHAHRQFPNVHILLRLLFLLSVVWHVCLASLVNLGVMPALYQLPEHCQPIHTQAASHVHADHQMMHHLHEHQHHASATLHVNMLKAKAEHQQEVFDLASKIMKSCPFCSHGLEGATLWAVALVLCLLFILRLPSRTHAVRSITRFYRRSPPYFKPRAHAPPLCLI